MLFLISRLNADFVEDIQVDTMVCASAKYPLAYKKSIDLREVLRPCICYRKLKLQIYFEINCLNLG